MLLYFRMVRKWNLFFYSPPLPGVVYRSVMSVYLNHYCPATEVKMKFFIILVWSNWPPELNDWLLLPTLTSRQRRFEFSDPSNTRSRDSGKYRIAYVRRNMMLNWWVPVAKMYSCHCHINAETSAFLHCGREEGKGSPVILKVVSCHSEGSRTCTVVQKALIGEKGASQMSFLHSWKSDMQVSCYFWPR